MNPQISYAPTDPEPTTPDLSDVLSMVAKLHAAAPGTAEFDRLALALSAADVEGMEGVVIDGEVYSLTRGDVSRVHFRAVDAEIARLDARRKALSDQIEVDV